MANRRCFKATRRKQRSEEELHNFLQGQEVLHAHIWLLHVHQPSEFTPLLEMQSPETCTTWHFHYYLYYKHYNPLDSLVHVPCVWAFQFALMKKRHSAEKCCVLASFLAKWEPEGTQRPKVHLAWKPFSFRICLAHALDVWYKAILTEDKINHQNKTKFQFGPSYSRTKPRCQKSAI